MELKGRYCEEDLELKVELKNMGRNWISLHILLILLYEELL